MVWKEYREIINHTPYTEGLEYAPVAAALRPQNIPVGVVSIGSAETEILRIPERAINRYGNTVPVAAIGRNAFGNCERVTDIIIPSCVGAVYRGAFGNCSSLERITIPRAVRKIEQGTFENCTALRDIYYEGSREEWERIEIVHRRRETEYGSPMPGSPVCEKEAERYIHIPGNEPLFAADIHFLCVL